MKWLSWRMKYKLTKGIIVSCLVMLEPHVRFVGVNLN